MIQSAFGPVGSSSTWRFASVVRAAGQWSIAALILLTVGCGRPSTTSTASNGGPIDACALLTVDEVAAVLGTAVSPPQNEVIGAGDAGLAAISQCVFTSTAEPTKSVSVFVRRSPVADNTPESMRKSLSEFGATVQDVSGIGDAALWDGTQLHIFKSEKTYVIITVSGFGEGAEALAKAKAVGEKATPRL